MTDAESARDRDAVDKSVQHQSRQRREAHHLRDVVHLFAEMEMRGEGVLGEVDQEVPDQDHQRRGFPVSPDRVRREIENRYRDHESGREGDHVLEGADAPLGMGDDRDCADDVGAGCYCRVRESGGVQEFLTN